MGPLSSLRRIGPDSRPEAILLWIFCFQVQRPSSHCFPVGHVLKIEMENFADELIFLFLFYSQREHSALFCLRIAPGKQMPALQRA